MQGYASATPAAAAAARQEEGYVTTATTGPPDASSVDCTEGALSGIVKSRRKMGGGLVFLMVQPLEEEGGGEVEAAVQLLFSPDVWQLGPDEEKQRGLLNLLRPGVVAHFATRRGGAGVGQAPGEGRAASLPGGDLVATSARILRVNAEQAAVRRVLEAVGSSVLSLGAAAQALSCAPGEVQALCRLLPAPAARAATTDEAEKKLCTLQATEDEMSEVATKLTGKSLRHAVIARCRLMKGLPPVKLGRQRGPHLRQRDLDILTAAEDAAGPRLQKVLEEENHAAPIVAEASEAVVGESDEDGEAFGTCCGHDGGGSLVSGDAETLGPAHPACNLLEPERKSRRGPMLMREYAHGKKAPQVKWFVSQLFELMRPASTDVHEAGDGREASIGTPPASVLQVLDIGGGRGDLAVVTASVFLGRCHVTVVDKNERSLEQGRARASALGLADNMSWRACGVSDLRAEDLRHIDVVLGLHACGGLTDAILDLFCKLHAQRRAAHAAGQPNFFKPVSLLVCPCCFYKNTDLIPSRGWTSGRPEHEVEVLTRLAESDDRNVSLRAMVVINSARLESIAATIGTPCGAVSTFRLTAFAEAWSLRNLVLQATACPCP